MADVIDTCGLSCPQPVLMMHEAAKQGGSAFDVLVDNEASRENVTRAAQKLGFTVNPVEREHFVCCLELRK